MLNQRNFFGWLFILVGVLVSFLLLDTYLAPYGLLAVQLWAWWLVRRWRQPLPAWVVGVGLVTIIGLSLNLVTSVSLPLSLQVAMKWLVGLQIWWLGWHWARHIKLQPQAQTVKLTWLGALLLLGTLSTLSLATWFIPAWHFLPDMNLLYATFGHSHLSVVLLLFFPLVVLADRIWPSRWWLVAIVGVVALMVGTFGRVALMVLTGQLVIMLGWLPKTDWSKRWLSWLAEIALGVIVVALVWSSLAGRGEFCPVTVSWQRQLCKSVKTEQRPEYWRQAWLGLQQHPWWGNGLGTFNLISQQYRKEPGSYSGFVHNDYLQLIVEAGWFGWLLVIGLWLGWWLARPQGVDLTTRTPSLLWFQWAIWLGLGGVLLNSMFDYDLQFTTILFATLGCLGALLGWWQPVKTTGSRFVFWQKQERLISAAITVVVLVYAGLFLALDYWWNQGQKNLVWQFGSVYQAYSLFLVNDFLHVAPTQQAQFLKWYGSQPRIIELLITGLLTQSHQVQTDQTRQLIARVHQLDPWSRLDYETVSFNIQTQNWDQAKADIQDADNFFTQQSQQFKVQLGTVDDEMRWQIASQSAQLAAVDFTQDKYTQGVEELQRTQRYEPWALASNPAYCQALLQSVHRTTPIDKTMVDYSHQLRQVLAPLLQIDPQYFSSCQTELTQVALYELGSLANSNLCQTESDDCDWWQRAILRWSSSADWAQRELTRLHYSTK